MKKLIILFVCFTLTTGVSLIMSIGPITNTVEKIQNSEIEKSEQIEIILNR